MPLSPPPDILSVDRDRKPCDVHVRFHTRRRSRASLVSPLCLFVGTRAQFISSRSFNECPCHPFKRPGLPGCMVLAMLIPKRLPQPLYHCRNFLKKPTHSLRAPCPSFFYPKHNSNTAPHGTQGKYGFSPLLSFFSPSSLISLFDR